MAQKRRFLDLWIIETNTVYKEVPYTVAVDWVQQGRLLEGDKYKPSGTKEWFTLGGSAEFQPYFPRRDESRPDDEAEALEPVDLGFNYKRPDPDADEDVDMIPLIDVTLVLLVFFMLTASVATMASTVNTPETEHAQMVDQPEGLRIDITRDEEDGSPIYALGVGGKAPEEGERDLRDLTSVFNRLEVRLKELESERKTPVELRINADKKLESGYSRDVLMGLRADRFRGKISLNYYGVSEKRQ